MLATHDKETMGAIINGGERGFERLPEGHPGRIAFHFFDNQNEKLKDGALGNLGTRLQLLQSRNIRRILRNRDIALADAGDHQVVWFVIIPDQSDATRAISSLFFNFVFKDNADMADLVGGKNRVRVNFIMDEFANIGLIPGIDKKINIARGRNLSLCVILQDIRQLDNVYGRDVAPVIIGGCNTIVFRIIPRPVSSSPSSPVRPLSLSTPCETPVVWAGWSLWRRSTRKAWVRANALFTLNRKSGRCPRRSA